MKARRGKSVWAVMQLKLFRAGRPADTGWKGSIQKERQINITCNLRILKKYAFFVLPNLSERQPLYKLAGSGLKLREIFWRATTKTEGGVRKTLLLVYLLKMDIPVATIGEGRSFVV